MKIKTNDPQRPLLRPKERLTQIREQVEQTLTRQKDLDHHWEDQIDVSVFFEYSFQILPTLGIRTLIKPFLFHTRPCSSSISLHRMHLLFPRQVQSKVNLVQLSAVEWREPSVCVMVEVGEFTWTDGMLFPDPFSINHAQNSLALMNQWMWTLKIRSKMKTEAVW